MADSETKHTLGPWTRGYGNYVYQGEKPFEHGPLIATCYPLNGSAKELEEAFANAQLVAAAPALLTALEGVLRVADRQTAEFDAARAAVVMARGDE